MPEGVLCLKEQTNDNNKNINKGRVDEKLKEEKVSPATKKSKKTGPVETGIRSVMISFLTIITCTIGHQQKNFRLV